MKLRETPADQIARVATHADRQARVARERTEQVRALFLSASAVFTISELSRKIGAGIQVLAPVVHALASAGELVGEMKGGDKTYYRRAQPSDLLARPAVRDVPIPMFRQADFRQSVTRALASGASYDVRELLRHVRQDFPQAETPMVEEILLELSQAGEVERIPLGSTTRYRRAVSAREISA